MEPKAAEERGDDDDAMVVKHAEKAEIETGEGGGGIQEASPIEAERCRMVRE